MHFNEQARIRGGGADGAAATLAADKGLVKPEYDGEIAVSCKGSASSAFCGWWRAGLPGPVEMQVVRGVEKLCRRLWVRASDVSASRFPWISLISGMGWGGGRQGEDE